MENDYIEPRFHVYFVTFITFFLTYHKQNDQFRIFFLKTTCRLSAINFLIFLLKSPPLEILCSKVTLSSFFIYWLTQQILHILWLKKISFTDFTFNLFAIFWECKSLFYLISLLTSTTADLHNKNSLKFSDFNRKAFFFLTEEFQDETCLIF